MSGEEEKRETKALRAVVRGMVQAVGFRQFVLMRARSLGLRGYVRNGDDARSVEVVAEGSVAALEELLQHLRRGPFLSRVDEVEVSWSEEAGSYDSFGVDF
jgi:acylphosphatase